MKITRQYLCNFERAIEFYERKGFENIEVPWFLSEEAVNITRPKDARLFNTPAGYLPASAEQSFLQMLIDGKLPAGRYQALTPCFRDDKTDEWHQNAFMKLELIDTTPDGDFGFILENAKMCFELLDMSVMQVKTVEGSREGELDLQINGIEVGSYGIRKYKDLTWRYGTGLAEPRYSMAVKHKK